MTERSIPQVKPQIAYDRLDAALSSQMVNEGCPNDRVEIVIGAPVKPEGQ